MKTLISAAVALGLVAAPAAMAHPWKHHRHYVPVRVYHRVVRPTTVVVWRQGGYVPVAYRTRTYYVTDWQTRRLHAPRPGYVWVRNDRQQYALMGMRTGIIYEIINALQ